MKKSKAFTRSDLIVSLFCVLFLFFTLGAVGTNGRKKAKQLICQSNLRKLYKATCMWLADHDSYFWSPIIVTSQGTKWSYKNWLMITARYYDYNPHIRLCPEASEPFDPGSPNVRAGGTSRAWYYYSVGSEEAEKVRDENYRAIGSYGFNSWLENPDRRTEWSWFRNRHRRYWRSMNVAHAGEIPFLLDSAWAGAEPRHTDVPPALPDYFEEANGEMQAFCMDRHNEQVNGVFLDGTIRGVGLKELWRLRWNREYDLDWPLPHWPSVAPWMADFKDY